MSVLEEVMTRPPSGRVYKALVETKKAATVSSEFIPRRDPGDIGFSATVRKEASLEEAKNALLSTVEGAAAAPISKEEVERARARLLRDIDLQLTNSEQVAMALTEWVAAGDWRLLFLHRDRIRKITPEEVQRAALTYLIPSNRTLGMFIPDDKPVRAAIPQTPDIAALVKDYKGDAAVAAGEVFDPATGNVEKRTTRAKLPNGMKLTLLPKKTRGETVAGVIQLNYGTAQSLSGGAMASNATRGMLMRGTTKHSRQQIQDELTRLKAQMNVTGSTPVTELTFQTTRANLPEVLKLAAEILREPAFPASEWEQYKQATLAAAEQNRTNPNAMASLALARHMNPYPANDPRYVEEVLHRLLWSFQCAIGTGWRFRCGTGAEANGRPVRQLEKPAAVAAHREKAPEDRLRQPGAGSARQGQRDVHGGVDHAGLRYASGLSGAGAGQLYSGRHFHVAFV
jgi:zinc protease